ncbi:hypothetical protein ABZ078_18920, partial [Streptomyces sp. NPDC006385]
MSDAEGAPVPDFLDRLIARHAPAAGPRPGVVRVRPRLPGPFERVEAVRATTAEPDDGTDLLWPATTPSAVPQAAAPRPATPAPRHTERERMAVRTERTPASTWTTMLRGRSNVKRAVLPSTSGLMPYESGR